MKNPLIHLAVAAALMLALLPAIHVAGAWAMATHQSKPPEAASSGGPSVPVPAVPVLFVGPSPSEDGTEYLMVMLIPPTTTVIGRISTVDVWQRFRAGKKHEIDIAALRKEMRAALLRLLEGKHAPSI
jgi:hypothetical protein